MYGGVIMIVIFGEFIKKRWKDIVKGRGDKLLGEESVKGEEGMIDIFIVNLMKMKNEERWI